MRRAGLAGKNRKFVKFAFNDTVFSRVVSFQNMAKFTVLFFVVSNIFSKLILSCVFWPCLAMLRLFRLMLRLLLRLKFGPFLSDAGQSRGRNSKQKKNAGPAWGWRPFVCAGSALSLCLLFLLLGRLEGLPDLRGGPTGGRLVGVGVYGQGGLYGGVTQALGDGSDIRPLLYGDAGKCVP